MSITPLLWSPQRPFARALVVVAHPDDAEFGAAGTVARWVEQGTDVRYLVATDGASGSSDPAMTRQRLAAIREEEQRAACAELGVKTVEFLDYRDGYLEVTLEARRKVAVAIRRHRPEVIVTFNPELRWLRLGNGADGSEQPDAYVNHPDHRAVGDLVLHCINPAASTWLWDPSLIDEGLEPWDVSEVWLMGFVDGEVAVDITETFDRKLAALRCHASQLGDEDPEPQLRQMAAARARDVGVELAELFTVLRLRPLDPPVGEPVG